MSKKIRFEVFKRDSFTCQYCGKAAPNVILHVDHVIPVSKDGDNDITNLITSCIDCNLGKSDRELSDDAVLQKRKKQLDELQERREQLEMMVEWQRGLSELDNQTVEICSDFWSELTPGYHLNEDGIKDLKKIIRRFGVSEVMSAMRISTEQYLVYENTSDDTENEIPIKTSVEKSWNYVSRICAIKQREKEKPYLRDLYYVRGILRNRMAIVDWQALDILENAHDSGIDIDDIKNIAKLSRNWNEWKSIMAEHIKAARDGNG